jgi:predicted DNA-binding protein (MmcQ/YjbR family)
MDIETFREYCLSKKGTSENFPFDEVTLCLRVAGKIFAITGLDSEQFTVNLKCDPDEALELRERYPEVQPGWHMNKKHWNTVDFEGSLDDNILRRLIDHSYDQVVKSLKKSERQALEAS